MLKGGDLAEETDWLREISKLSPHVLVVGRCCDCSCAHFDVKLTQHLFAQARECVRRLCLEHGQACLVMPRFKSNLSRPSRHPDPARVYSRAKHEREPLGPLHPVTTSNNRDLSHALFGMLQVACANYRTSSCFCLALSVSSDMGTTAKQNRTKA